MKINVGFGVEIEINKHEDTPKEMTGLVIRNNFTKMEVLK